MNQTIISAFKSKTVWLLVAGALGYALDHYTQWAWFSNLEQTWKDLILALWGVLLVWARNQAAKTGDVISFAKTVGLKKETP